MFQLFLKLLDFGLDDGSAVRLVGIAAVVILVVTLGFVKFGQRHDLSDNRIGKILLGFRLGFFGRFFLGLITVKDDRTVLCA